MGELDIALRAAATRGAADIAAVALNDAAQALSLRWLDSQVVRAERRADKGCLLEFAERRRLLHTEWFAAPEADLGWRVYEYQYLLLELVRQEDEAAAEAARKRHPQRKPPAPKPVSVTSLVVLLSGPDGDRATRGSYPISDASEDFAGARYAVDRVYQRTSRELAERAGAFWLVFSPLAVDATTATVEAAVKAARARASSEEHFAALASTMTAVAGATAARDVFLEAIMGQLTGNFLTANPLYERGVEAGIKKGILVGRAAGEAAALHDALLVVLESRALRVTEAQRARILATDDRATLEAWLRAAASAATVGEVLRHAPAAPARARKGR